MKEQQAHQEDRITRDPKIMAGKPVVTGTRIPDTDHFTLVRIDPQGDEAHVPVRGVVDYGPPNNAPRVAAFVPEAELEKGCAYQATITRGVRDLAGNALAEDYTWR